MDTPHPPPIVTQPLKRKERSPSPARRTPSHTPTMSSRPSPTSLPSIRHFLPPQPDAQLGERHGYHPNRQQGGPSAFSGGPSAGIPRLDFRPSPAQPPAERAPSGIVADSDGDGDSEHAARPKQKRRRQALSCTGQSAISPVRFSLGRRLIYLSSFFRARFGSLTQPHFPLSIVCITWPSTECKRRKIKCDR
jgi:hypothetical protein